MKKNLLRAKHWCEKLCVESAFEAVDWKRFAKDLSSLPMPEREEAARYTAAGAAPRQ